MPVGAEPTIQFFSASGHANARPTLDDLIRSATEGFRGAVCYFTRAGLVLLRTHRAALDRQGSFFVIGVDWPTDLAAVSGLHEIAPGRVYIHLGGATPKERRVGRALMHSKMLLAAGSVTCRLWVGSHNFTAQGITGGNIEAGLQVMVPTGHTAIVDAESHLQVCRATSELFDPAQIDRYRAIQNERLPLPPWVRRTRLLVIHAETTVTIASTPFTVHFRVVPTDFDHYFQRGGGVRLYLHRPGQLKRGVPADFRNVTLWTGVTTGVNDTERHPNNAGVEGDFPNANYHLDLPNLFSAPVLSPAKRGHIGATSQVVIRITAQGQPGMEVYSLDEAPVENEYDSDANGQFLHEIDPDMRSFFTSDSVSDDGLIYRQVRGMKQTVKVSGYKETMRTDAALLEDGARREVVMSVRYEDKESPRPADAFVFVSKYVVDRSQQ